jgi:hypothetical protein
MKIDYHTLQQQKRGLDNTQLTTVIYGFRC